MNNLDLTSIPPPYPTPTHNTPTMPTNFCQVSKTFTETLPLTLSPVILTCLATGISWTQTRECGWQTVQLFLTLIQFIMQITFPSIYPHSRPLKSAGKDPDTWEAAAQDWSVLCTMLSKVAATYNESRTLAVEQRMHKRKTRETEYLPETKISCSHCSQTFQVHFGTLVTFRLAWQSSNWMYTVAVIIHNGWPRWRP